MDNIPEMKNINQAMWLCGYCNLVEPFDDTISEKEIIEGANVWLKRWWHTLPKYKQDRIREVERAGLKKGVKMKEWPKLSLRAKCVRMRDALNKLEIVDTDAATGYAIYRIDEEVRLMLLGVLDFAIPLEEELR